MKHNQRCASAQIKHEVDLLIEMEQKYNPQPKKPEPAPVRHNDISPLVRFMKEDCDD